MMKQLILMGGALASTLALVGCGGGGAETPTPMPEPAFESLVSVTGEVVPGRWAALSIRTGGTVNQVLVEPGDQVEAGDLLVELDTTDAELAIQEAEARLASVRAELERLRAQPRFQDVAAAEQQVEAAQAEVSQATAERDRLASGAISSDITSANAQVVAAEAGRKAAQIDYDETRRKVEDDDVEAWREQEAALRLRAAETRLDAARLRLAAARTAAGPRREEAEARVRAAEAQRDVAAAQLAQLQAGPADQEITLAETDVAQARLTLEEVQLALQRCERRAPFDGTVGMVHVREGEQVHQGDPILTLGDLSTLRVETTDLDEIDVAKVRVGQGVDVTFDAFPDCVFKGRITRLDPMPMPGGGGVNYTAIIALEELAPEIRWGMTAFVDIELEG
ncbi:MAG: HlyD family efflux transporter periplasmic adaptor subunit [Chloroflexota bacterium]|nr:HlyD family efflux transporter periplasmic adaptor subunit [Chloroflexota bacterium]